MADNDFSISLSDNNNDVKDIKIDGVGTYFTLHQEDNGNYSVQSSKPIHTILKKVSLSNFNSMMETLKEMYPDSEVTFNPNSVEGDKAKFEKRYLGDQTENKEISKPNIKKNKSATMSNDNIETLANNFMNNIAPKIAEHMKVPFYSQWIKRYMFNFSDEDFYKQILSYNDIDREPFSFRDDNYLLTDKEEEQLPLSVDVIHYIEKRPDFKEWIEKMKNISTVAPYDKKYIDDCTSFQQYLDIKDWIINTFKNLLKNGDREKIWNICHDRSYLQIQEYYEERVRELVNKQKLSFTGEQAVTCMDNVAWETFAYHRQLDDLGPPPNVESRIRREKIKETIDSAYGNGFVGGSVSDAFDYLVEELNYLDKRLDEIDVLKKKLEIMEKTIKAPNKQDKQLENKKDEKDKGISFDM